MSPRKSKVQLSLHSDAAERKLKQQEWLEKNATVTCRLPGRAGRISKKTCKARRKLAKQPKSNAATWGMEDGFIQSMQQSFQYCLECGEGK